MATVAADAGIAATAHAGPIGTHSFGSLDWSGSLIPTSVIGWVTDMLQS